MGKNTSFSKQLTNYCFAAAGFFPTLLALCLVPTAYWKPPTLQPLGVQG
jgi:hypothetical protein